MTITSCDDEDFVIVNFRVNHYKQSAVGLSPTLVLLVQEGDKIGTDEWIYHYSEINGFNYEWGYVYDLRIKKTMVDNPPADASSIEFDLEEIISKKQVEPNLTFKISLKSSTRGIKDLVVDNAVEYTLLNEQRIDCSDLCDQMAESLANQAELTGIFVHINSESIKLQKLLLE